MINMKKNSMLAASTIALANLPAVVSATSPAKLMAVCGTGLSNFFGFQPWYACLQDSNGNVVIDDINDLFLIIFPLVDSLVKAGALVAAGIMFFLFIQIVLARGDSGKIATSVKGIRDAIIGLVICLISVALINFVQGAFVAT